MPQRKRFRKRTYKKKRTYGGYVRTGMSVARTAVNALSLAQKVARMVNSEVKRKDHQGTGTVISSDSPTVVNLTQIAQGDGPTSRDGCSAKLAHLTCRIALGGSGSATSGAWVRVVLLRMKIQNQSDPTWATFLEDSSATDAIVSPKAWDNKFDSNVLYDRVFSLAPNAADEGNDGIKRIVINKKLFGHVNWASGDTAGTLVESGGLYLMMISNHTAAGTPPVATYFARLTFYDN